MTTRLFVVIAGLGLAALGVGIVAATWSADGGRLGAPVASAVAAPARGQDPRLDGAIKALALIRPTRVKSADDFRLPTPEGGEFRLAAHRGHMVLVNFWATWCPPCLAEMPAMERLYRQHKDAGLVIVAVSVDLDPRVVKPFVDKHGFTFPVALDSRMEVADRYGVRALPSSFIVDRAGNLAALAIGPREWDNRAAHALVEGLTR